MSSNKLKFPLSIQGSYDINLITIGEQTALLTAPVEKIPLVTLRKQYHQITMYSGLPCVFYMKEMSYYTRDALLEEGIPFVWEEHQLYLPFLGMLLDDHPRKNMPACTQISYLTQRLLLTALYQGWKKVTVTKAAAIFSVSKMSITRCFDELEALDVSYLSVQNRSRYFSADSDKKTMWKNIREFLRDPVIKTYALKNKPAENLPLSGETALAHSSMLDYGPYPFLAIRKNQIKLLNLSADNIASAGEDPGCILQELGYWIPFENEVAADPLTTVISISNEAKEDTRISKAIDEMLEEYVW